MEGLKIKMLIVHKQYDLGDMFWYFISSDTDNDICDSTFSSSRVIYYNNLQ